MAGELIMDGDCVIEVIGGLHDAARYSDALGGTAQHAPIDRVASRWLGLRPRTSPELGQRVRSRVGSRVDSTLMILRRIQTSRVPSR